MGRALLDAVALFIAPFVAYGLVLLLRQRYPWLADSWSRGSLATLTVAGLALVLIGLLLLGTLADRHKGAYVPARLENGRLIPGHLE
ncbi:MULTISPECIES: DUF6111 family protein [Lichenihabitans]|uniref:DUF6111 family protein n=1 Tax=Lichenihabitans TaxID=2723776 RepID=UPI001035543A|nr:MULTISPECIES: DUF6111 family protein [Lichenihabitans]UDL94648.1 DUF6111 family protein [Lichenihabitans sp. PAMC28606]